MAEVFRVVRYDNLPRYMADVFCCSFLGDLKRMGSRPVVHVDLLEASTVPFATCNQTLQRKIPFFEGKIM